VHVTLTEAACILSLSCCILDNLYIHMLGVQKYGVAYAMAYASQATRRIQIQEQHDNTWPFGESGPG
jgi:hypothetical protein